MTVLCVTYMGIQFIEKSMSMSEKVELMSTIRMYKRLARLGLIVALSLLHPPASAGSVHIDLPCTQFVAFPTNTPSVDRASRVGVFNAFVGTDAMSATRVTVGPDSFADITLIAPKLRER